MYIFSTSCTKTDTHCFTTSVTECTIFTPVDIASVRLGMPNSSKITVTMPEVSLTSFIYKPLLLVLQSR